MSLLIHRHLSQKQKLTLADRMMMVVSIVQPFATVPQIIEIWTSQSAQGVSIWTWLGFAVIGAVFLYYGIMHRLKPIIINQVIWFVLDALVIIGILLYG